MELQNPEYTFCYYDDVQMLNWVNKNCDFEVKNTFDKINPKYGVVKADLFRYLIMHKVGGIYLDIKSDCLVPFDALISNNDTFITSHWFHSDGRINSFFGNHKSLLENDLVEFQQWFLIAEPKHHIMSDVTSAVVWNLRKKQSLFNSKFGRVGVLETSGPIVFTKILSKFKLGDEFTLINSKAAGLVYSIYDEPAFGSHHKLFQEHYSELFEPIIKSKKIISIIKSSFNKFFKQHYLRLELKIFRIIRSRNK